MSHEDDYETEQTKMKRGTPWAVAGGLFIAAGLATLGTIEAFRWAPLAGAVLGGIGIALVFVSVHRSR